MAKVFISSTGLDLQGYRTAAVTTCLRLGLTPVAMEFFGAMGAGAVAGILAQMDDAKVYIGIFAHRYGYVAGGSGVSVTEAEFDHAGQLGVPRLCFLIDPTHPWPPDAVDHVHHQRLEAFKQRVRHSVICEEFTTVEDFAAKLTHALVGWRQRTFGPHGDAVPEQDTSGAGAPPSTAPSTPTLLVGRHRDLEAIKERVRPEQPATVVVRGWPGVGKTTFAAALANDPEIRGTFSDGVLWASLGERPEVFSTLTAWAQTLGVGGLDRTVGELHDRLRAVLWEQRCLLVVDDAWDVDAALAFGVGGPRCSTVYTTRSPAVARELSMWPDGVYVLGQLDEPGGLELLSCLAPNVAAHSPEPSRRLVRELEGLPLAIRVASRLLESELHMGWGITDLLGEITEGAALLGARAPEDRFDPATQTIPTVSALLDRSTDRLDDQTRTRFAYLGAFASKPATFDLQAMQSVWETDDPKPTARRLADRGLLEPIIGTGRFQLHAVLVLHAKSLLTRQ